MNPQPERSVTVYAGRVFYNMKGEIIDETGSDNLVQADKRIVAMEQGLVGRWAFSVLKVRKRVAAGEEWASSVIFPDGKSRRLVVGEISANSPKSRGKWLTYEAAVKFLSDSGLKFSVRSAPDVRFPWRSGSIMCRIERFKDLDDFKAWMQIKVEGNTLFIVNPTAANLPPDEEALYAYCVIAPK